MKFQGSPLIFCYRKIFGSLWHEIYEELCVLKCEICGLSQGYLPNQLQFGLQVQVTRLFELHERIFEVVIKRTEGND